MGLRKVALKAMGPAMNSKEVRVAVNCIADCLALTTLGTEAFPNS